MGQVRAEAQTRLHQQRLHKLQAASEPERQQIEASMRGVMPELDQSSTWLNSSPPSRGAVRAERPVETQRFLQALRSQLAARLKAQGIELPRLCNCGSVYWENKRVSVGVFLLGVARAAHYHLLGRVCRVLVGLPANPSGTPTQRRVRTTASFTTTDQVCKQCNSHTLK